MSNIYVGMDVHQSAITLVVLPAIAPAPSRVDALNGAMTRFYIRTPAR